MAVPVICGARIRTAFLADVSVASDTPARNAQGRFRLIEPGSAVTCSVLPRDPDVEADSRWIGTRVLGGIRRSGGGSARQPPPDPRPILLVFRTEQAFEGRLLVRHDEDMRGEKKKSCIAHQRDRAVEESGAAERERCSDVHRIADIPIGTLNHELTGRIERRRCAATDQGERHDAPQSERPAGDSHDDAGVFDGAELGRPDDPGPVQDPRWNENEQQADEERRVGCGPD